MIAIATMTLHIDGGPSEDVGAKPALDVPKPEDLVKPKATPGKSRMTNIDPMDRPEIRRNEAVGNSGPIVKMRTQEYKAKPTDSSIRGQWYTPESNVQAQPSK